MNDRVSPPPKSRQGLDPATTAFLILNFTKHYAAESHGSAGREYDQAMANTDELSRTLKERYPGMAQIWVSDATYDVEGNYDPRTNRFVLPETILKSDVVPAFFNDNPDVYDHVIVTNNFDAFKGRECETGKTIDDILQEKGIRTVVIAGAMMPQGVLHTALAAKTFFYKAVCVSDCVSGGYRVKSDILNEYAANNISMGSARTILDILEGDYSLSHDAEDFSSEKKISMARDLCHAFGEPDNLARYKLIAEKMPEEDLIAYAQSVVPPSVKMMNAAGVMLGGASAVGSAVLMQGFQGATVCFGIAGAVSLFKAVRDVSYNKRLEHDFDDRLMHLPPPAHD